MKQMKLNKLNEHEIMKIKRMNFEICKMKMKNEMWNLKNEKWKMKNEKRNNIKMKNKMKNNIKSKQNKTKQNNYIL